MRERRESSPSSAAIAEVDAAAEIDAVGAVVDFDQHGESMGRAGLLAHCPRDRLGRLAAQFA